MANCTYCGKSVTAAPIWHPECHENTVEKLTRQCRELQARCDALLADLRSADVYACVCCKHNDDRPDCALECMDGGKACEDCYCITCRDNDKWEWRKEQA